MEKLVGVVAAASVAAKVSSLQNSCYGEEAMTKKNSLSAFACRHLFLCALKKWNQTCKEVAAKLSI